MIDAKTCINDAQEKMDMAVMYLELPMHAVSPSSHGTKVCSVSSKKLSWTLIWASLPKTTVKLSVWVFRH